MVHHRREQKGTEEGARRRRAPPAAGVLHNLIHPSLRAWNTCGQTQVLLMTLQQVLQMPSPQMHEKGVKVQQSDEVRQFTAPPPRSSAPRPPALTGHHTIASPAPAWSHRAERQEEDEKATAQPQQSAMAVVLLQRCRVAGGYACRPSRVGPVLDRLLDDEGADEMRAEAVAVFEQHNLLASAFVKFGFEGAWGFD